MAPTCEIKNTDASKEKQMKLTPEEIQCNNDDNNNTNELCERSSPSSSHPSTHAENPKELIPEICKQFYANGWVSGTGGGMSIRQNGFIYCAPSGVQKERLKADDIFVLNDKGEILERPRNDKLKCSECLSLFMLPYMIRNAGCCLHSHSLNANMVTALCYKLRRDKRQQQDSKSMGSHLEFRIRNQEMIKGIKQGSSDQCLKYSDTLVVPIIDNSLYERDLAGSMGEAIMKYPLTNAILVQNHGLYVWGRTWMEAKSMAECYDYLFRVKLEAYKFGFDWMIDDD